MKKGQGLSVNTIVVAALAVTILVILVLVFVSNINKTNQGINNCENKGYECVVDKKLGCTGKGGVIQIWDCPDVGSQKQFCCALNVID
jgi:hypothetical protein